MKLLLLPLLLIALSSQVEVESKSIFKKIFHINVGHKVGNWFHSFAHKFEHDVEKIGHVLEKIPSELDGELHHLEEAFGPLWHDLEKVTKKLVTFVRNFQPWLIKINSKIFGPTLGPLLEKLELAALETIPIVGEGVALVVDGVDIYDDIVAAKGCWDKKDMDCVGKEVANALLKIAGTMTAEFSSASKFAGALKEAGELIEAGVTINDAITKEIPLIKQGIELIKKHDASDIIKGLADIGQGLEGVLDNVEHAIPTTLGKYQRAADALQKYTKVLDEGGRILAAGADIVNNVKDLIKCWNSEDWGCVGKEVANIAAEIEKVAPKNAALQKICHVLSGIPDDIAFAQDIVKTYQLFDTCFNDIKTAKTEADWKKAISDLGTALGTVNTDITALNKAVGSKAVSKIQKLEDQVQLIVAQATKIDQEVAYHGFNIYDDLVKMAGEWKAHKYEQFAKTLGDLLQNVEQVAEDYPKLEKVTKALKLAIRVDNDGVQLYDIFAVAWPALQKAITEIESGTPQGIAQGYIDLANFVEKMSDSVSAVDPAIASAVKQISKYFHTEIVIAEDLQKVFVAGLDVAPLVKKSVGCFKRQDWACVGAQIGQMIDDIKKDLPQWKVTKDIIVGLSEAQTGFKLASDAEQTVALFEASLDLLKKGVETPDADDTQKGLEKLGLAIESVTAELEDVDKLTFLKFHDLAQKLEKDVAIADAKLDKATPILVDGVNIYEDATMLVACYKSKDWVCVGKEIKKLKDIISGMKPGFYQAGQAAHRKLRRPMAAV